MDRQGFQSSEAGRERLPTPRDILTPLFRHGKLVVLTFVIVVLGAILAIVLLPKDYEAKMEILVKRERVDAAVSPGRDDALASPGDVTEEEINSEVELLKSRDLLEKVVLSCDLQDSHSSSPWSRFFPTAAAHGAGGEPQDPRDISEAVASLENKLQAEPLKKTDLIQVTYDSPDPQMAARVLGMLGNLYVEKTVEVHGSPGASEFFQSESQHYDQELHTAEAQLTEFDRDTGEADPDLEKQITLQKLAEFEGNLNATQVAIKETEKRAQGVEEQLASTPEQTLSQVHTSENPYLMEQLKTTLLNLELKRTALLENFEPDYRPVQEVQQEIEQTLDSIAKAQESPVREETTDRNPSYDWLRSELVKSDADLATLHARAAETSNVIHEYRAQLSTIVVNGATQENLVRDVKEAEGNYLLSVQKGEEARIGDALDRQRIVNVAIAEAPTVPALPLHPHWALTLLLGTLLASIVSPGLAYAVDYFDPSLRTPDQVQEALQAPVLAALPKTGGRTHVP